MTEDFAKYYHAKVAEWTAKYGVPKHGLRHFNPADLQLTCVKCGKLRAHMHRHHIARDFYFAVLYPDVFAANYIQFRKIDVAKLCKKCHRDVHKLYQVISFDMLVDNRRTPLTIQRCLYWMSQYRAAFEGWLAEPVVKRKRKKKRRRTNV